MLRIENSGSVVRRRVFKELNSSRTFIGCFKVTDVTHCVITRCDSDYGLMLWDDSAHSFLKSFDFIGSLAEIFEMMKRFFTDTPFTPKKGTIRVLQRNKEEDLLFSNSLILLDSLSLGFGDNSDLLAFDTSGIIVMTCET